MNSQLGLVLDNEQEMFAQVDGKNPYPTPCELEQAMQRTQTDNHVLFYNFSTIAIAVKPPHMSCHHIACFLVCDDVKVSYVLHMDVCCR